MNIRGGTVSRSVLRPELEVVNPVVKTEWCEALHFQYQIFGPYRVKMKDGTEFDIQPGDVCIHVAGA